MRITRGIAAACLLLGGCALPFEAGVNEPPEEQGTYDTAVRDTLPLPEGEGAAPYEGSLGPPDRMVDPVLLGDATTTREGSGGPPYGVLEEEPEAGEPEAEPAEEERAPRRWLHGHDADAW